MVKRTKKTDADQKNKQGFDSSNRDSEFSKEVGSTEANRIKKEEAKQRREDHWEL